MYAFFSFEEVLDACRNWLKSPGHRETPSSLYRWEDVYFLIVKKPPKALCALLQEYGEDVENTTADLAFINEHGQKLLEGNALSCLGRL